jgi:multidrug efflux pump
MSLSSLSLKRPVLATVMSLVIVLFGVIGYNFLGVREYPSIDPPVINVRTSYTGANADIIESQVTEPLEKAINGIAGIRNISSESNLGFSNITVEFDLSVDLEAAANDVRDKVSQAQRQLPQDIDAPPVVSKADANSDAILSMTVQSNTRSQLDVCNYATNVLVERLQTIPDVSGIQIWGEKQYAMRIWFDPMRLAAYKLTFGDVVNALNHENVELPAGKIYGDNSELIVKTFGRLSTENDFRKMIISSQNGQTVRLEDVASVLLGPNKEESMLKESGIPMIALAVIPQPGANYIEIADEFYKRFEQLKAEVPEDIKLNIALDNTVFIRKSIVEVKETLIIAFLLVVLIIFLFFRDWTMAVRPLIDIPVSLIGAFFIMYLSGFTINVLSLLAIVLATGLVVDDGIVVAENIYRKMEGGMPRMQAAREGANEIFFAVIATSVTLAVVFLPIIFLEGFVGRLFREFGIVLAGAVLISSFVALSLTPVLFVKLTPRNHKPSRFYHATEPFFRSMENAYRSSLEWFISKRWLSFLLVLLCAGITYFSFINLQKELAPIEDRSVLRMIVNAPEGVSFDYMDKYMNQISSMIMDSVPEHEIVLTVTAPGFTGSGAVNTGFVRIRLSQPSERDRSQQEIANKLNQLLQQQNKGRAFVRQDPTISSGGLRGGQPVQFVLQNSDFGKIAEFLPKFMEKALQSEILMGVDVNLKFNKPELNVEINRLKAQEAGLSVSEISEAMQLALSGRRIGYFIMQGRQYEVIGQVDRNYRDEPNDLKSFYVRTPSGEMVQIDNFIDVEELSNPPQLYHFNRYKSATVSSGLAPGKTIGDGVEEMQRIAAEVLDDSFRTDFIGDSRDFTESSSNIWFAFVLALILVYLVLAAQFESFRDPLIIMFTVPLAFAGALLSLIIFGLTINIFSQIGIIMLIGLVTKNGILIVEFANQIRDKGEEKVKAVTDASVLRLRPILMTSIATALGALPIALAYGSGATSRIPLGVVVVGGVMFSLILTLYVIPAIYTYLSGGREQDE